MICTLFLAGSSNAELVIAKKNLEWNIGDYVKYEIMGDTFATMKLAKLINDQDKKLWKSSLETTNREDTNLTIEKHRTFCITESFFGKTLPLN